ncbi:MAG: YihY/virulence factor BrkB family protein [Gemmatimonadaceae bacterium]
MVIKGYNVGALLRRTGKEILADGVPTLAAQTAYYFFFSLFPLLLFLTPLLSLVGERDQVMQFLTWQIQSSVRGDAAKPLADALANVVYSENAPGLMSVGALLAAWSGSNIFGSLMASLNTAYDVEENRPWWKRQLLRLFVFVVAAVIMILATVTILAGEDIIDRVGMFIGIGHTGRLVWTIIQFPLAFSFLVGLGFMVYYFLPNVRQDWRKVVVASAVMTVLWIAATLAFRMYVQYFPPNPTYGFIGGVIILLTWMYYSMFVVLAGGELAAELQHGTGAAKPETGAVYHGRILSEGPTDTSSVARTKQARDA